MFKIDERVRILGFFFFKYGNNIRRLLVDVMSFYERKREKCWGKKESVE